MTQNKSNNSAENTRAVVRAAIRDCRSSSVQARIRRTRVERNIANLRYQQRWARDADEAKRIEAKLLQNLQLCERVLRNLADAETQLQALLKMDRELQIGIRADLVASDGLRPALN